MVQYQPDLILDRDWFVPSAPEGADLSRLAAVVTSVSPAHDGGDLVTLTVFQPTQGPWALSRCVTEGTAPGTWSWPPMAPLAQTPR